jgi:hypothetical protein
MTMEHVRLCIPNRAYTCISDGQQWRLVICEYSFRKIIYLDSMTGIEKFTFDEFANHVGRFHIATRHEGSSGSVYEYGSSISCRDLSRRRKETRKFAIYDINTWVGLPSEIHSIAAACKYSWMGLMDELISGYQYAERPFGYAHMSFDLDPGLQSLVPSLRIWMREPFNRMRTRMIMYLRRVVHKDIAPVIVRMVFHMRYVF